MFSKVLKKIAVIIAATTLVSSFSISAYADDENDSSDVDTMEPTVVSEKTLAMLSPRTNRET